MTEISKQICEFHNGDVQVDCQIGTDGLEASQKATIQGRTTQNMCQDIPLGSVTKTTLGDLKEDARHPWQDAQIGCSAVASETDLRRGKNILPYH
jgi:hypothetical protein